MMRPTIRISRRNGQSALLGLMMLMAAAGAVQAAPQTCTRPPNAPDPVVRVTTSVPPITYRFEKPEAELRRLHGGKMPGEQAPAGLTVSEFGFELRNGRTLSYKMANGRSCIWVSEIEAVLSLRKLDVYVAREYPRGSCESKLVLEHENKHVAFHKQVLEPAARRIEADYRKYLATRNPQVADPGQVGKTLVDVARPALDAMHKEDRRLNAAIDTPEAYRSTWARCK